ncbi:hypothetical protein MSAN_02285300 [Mycena sanguinolenta]|uniref:Uncharacterized protein n=1 Tax=Mycena sanguinolenta TaxID=230812 RepID=A0A8H6X9G8_9AGAR|nr:hypothetical protein MSAN_02285300 [Mycena sanguinolenta]
MNMPVPRGPARSLWMGSPIRQCYGPPGTHWHIDRKHQPRALLRIKPLVVSELPDWCPGCSMSQPLPAHNPTVCGCRTVYGLSHLGYKRQAPSRPSRAGREVTGAAGPAATKLAMQIVRETSRTIPHPVATVCASTVVLCFSSRQPALCDHWDTTGDADLAQCCIARPHPASSQ